MIVTVIHPSFLEAIASLDKTFSPTHSVKEFLALYSNWHHLSKVYLRQILGKSQASGFSSIGGKGGTPPPSDPCPPPWRPIPPSGTVGSV